MNPCATTTIPDPGNRESSRMLPSRAQLALVVGLALTAAVALTPWTRNTFLELLGETLFVGMFLLFALTMAGAWRQPWLPRWVAQVLAIALAAAVAPLIVQLLSAGGEAAATLLGLPLLRPP